LDPGRPPVRDMGREHGRVDVVVPQEFLGDADVVAVCEQVRGDRVAQCVGLAPLAIPTRRASAFTMRRRRVSCR